MTVSDYITNREQDHFTVFCMKNGALLTVYDSMRTPYEPDADTMRAEIETIYNSADGVPALEI